ncbi:hypothetical protein AJ80_06001 [Polytolypa hystricis UAMH7299]|uniref:DJ-1/PfpI domain-containing protein n=1 Tax=Polytolypa hystricis (strain UAMH7299) TaxID=1447883 RepID=A0A2B7XZQ4_POLH7|nr:hypothetical protein AJ80_06001 [Polytolypa hystricis UAMH7299]
MASPSPLRIGVLLAYPVQLLDLSSVDLFAMASKSYLSSCNLPSSITSLAIESEIYYIGPSTTTTSSSSSSPTNKTSARFTTCTANASLQTTHHITSPSLRPGNLDILFIPGADPNLIPSTDVCDFISAHYANGHGATVLAVCTGVIFAGYAGVIKGKRVTGPRMLVGGLKGKFPDAKEWVSGVRWVRDGKVWTCGGITNGNDLVAAYIRETFPGPLAEVICALADVGDRKREYETGLARDTGFFVWQIFRAFPVSWWRRVWG